MAELVFAPTARNIMWYFITSNSRQAVWFMAKLLTSMPTLRWL